MGRDLRNRVFADYNIHHPVDFEMRLVMDVGKREDALLDTIGTLYKRRDSAIAWLELMAEDGRLDRQLSEWLQGVLNGSEEQDGDG